MPDENFASSEHELIQEITAPLSAVDPKPPAEPEQIDFPIVLRGYDRLAVDAYVRQTHQEVSDLRSMRSPDVAVRRALERVGEEVSGILQRAHETAEKITAHSRSEAEDRLESARKEAAEIKTEAARELEAARRDATEIRAQAERQLTDLDAETDRIWAERHRIVEDARELASQLLALADSAAERFPPAEEPEPVGLADGVAEEEPPPDDLTQPTAAMPKLDHGSSGPSDPELIHETFPERGEPSTPPRPQAGPPEPPPARG